MLLSEGKFGLSGNIQNVSSQKLIEISFSFYTISILQGWFIFLFFQRKPEFGLFRIIFSHLFLQISWRTCVINEDITFCRWPFKDKEDIVDFSFISSRCFYFFQLSTTRMYFSLHRKHALTYLTRFYCNLNFFRQEYNI